MPSVFQKSTPSVLSCIQICTEWMPQMYAATFQQPTTTMLVQKLNAIHQRQQRRKLTWGIWTRSQTVASQEGMGRRTAHIVNRYLHTKAALFETTTIRLSVKKPWPSPHTPNRLRSSLIRAHCWILLIIYISQLSDIKIVLHLSYEHTAQ